MKSLSDQNVGLYLAKGEKPEVAGDIFFRPHPDTLTDTSDIIEMSDVILDEYTARFNDHTDLSDVGKRLCTKYHPESEILGFSQETDSEESEEETVELTCNVAKTRSQKKTTKTCK